MIGKKLSSNRSFLLLFSFCLFSQNIQSQVPRGLEQKAIEYFCDNVTQIKKGLIDYNIRFNGKTTGSPSSVYSIADCIGDISLIKDSIPNKEILDSLENVYSSTVDNSIPLVVPKNCKFLKKKLFAPFNKRIYSLQVFNAINYEGEYFVELYLANRNLNTWTICIKFNDNKETLEHFVAFKVY